MEEFRILFELRELREIRPWDGPQGPSLSWFGLSDGCYAIDTPAGRLFEHSDPLDPGLGRPWCDYQVARLFEDLVEIVPAVLEPVPGDVSRGFFDWYPNAREKVQAYDLQDRRLDVYYETREWLRQRTVDTLYLASKPEFHIWRNGPAINLTWNADSPWLVRRAEIILPVDVFRTAVEHFFRRFLAAMASRVQEVTRKGWRGAPCRIDLAGLAKRQAECERDAATALEAAWATDWDLVRRRLEEQ